MIISITRPGLLSVVFSSLIDLTTFDILPIDTWYDIGTGVEPESPTEPMGYCKYESNAFIRNVGSVVVFFWFILYVIGIT